MLSLETSACVGSVSYFRIDEAARAALFAAKHAGRNRSTILNRDLEATTIGVFSASEAPFAKVASG